MSSEKEMKDKKIKQSQDVTLNLGDSTIKEDVETLNTSQTRLL